MENFNQLTPAETERLALLLEELGEAQQAIGKILRHGYENYHPEIDNRNNRMDLEKELGHVQLAVDMLVSAGDLHRQSINVCADEKNEEIYKWLHHA